MAFNMADLIAQILTKLRGEIASDWQSVSSFARKQTEMIATQAMFITESRTIGSLRHKDALFRFFVDQLKTMTANFARALAAMTIITLEKAWNAVSNLVWGAINGALTGAGLLPVPVPAAPKP